MGSSYLEHKGVKGMRWKKGRKAKPIPQVQLINPTMPKQTAKNGEPYDAYQGNSVNIVDICRSMGISGSFKNRKRIAMANGMQGFTGTMEENMKLVNLAKAGKLKSPKSSDSDRKKAKESLKKKAKDSKGDGELKHSDEIKHYGRSINDGAPGVGTGNWRRGGGLYPHNRDSVYKSVEAKKKKETLKEIAKKNATENLSKSFIGRLALRGSKSIARKRERRKEMAEAKKEKKQAVKEAKEVSKLKKQLVKASLSDDLGKYSDEEINKAKNRLLMERQYREELAKTPEAKAMIAKQQFKQELKSAAKYALLEGAKKGGAAIIQYQIQKAGGLTKNNNNNNSNNNNNQQQKRREKKDKK